MQWRQYLLIKSGYILLYFSFQSGQIRTLGLFGFTSRFQVKGILEMRRKILKVGKDSLESLCAYFKIILKCLVVMREGLVGILEIIFILKIVYHLQYFLMKYLISDSLKNIFKENTFIKNILKKNIIKRVFNCIENITKYIILTYLIFLFMICWEVF